ncbi:hypothetical protein TNCV_328191 [Trichonephila clavipes]|nr:hypothetical protein TNCV_328191 [Trichonephila clavipes]
MFITYLYKSKSVISRDLSGPVLDLIFPSIARETFSHFRTPMLWYPGASADWKYTRIYSPQRRLRVLVEKGRKDSSQNDSLQLIESWPNHHIRDVLPGY